jgi:hypothetical protein
MRSYFRRGSDERDNSSASPAEDVNSAKVNEEKK